MTKRSLDHLVVVVPELDPAAGVFEELGFLVTDRSDHPFGTSNRLIVLDNAYIELVAVTDGSVIPAEGFARFVADAFDDGRFGPLMVVVSTNDPEADHQHLTESGLPSSGPISFGRWVDTPSGERVRAEFVTVFTHLGSEVFSGFYCQHLTPEVVWDPDVMGHPNGAGRITEVLVTDPGPEPWRRLSQVAESSDSDPIHLVDFTLGTGEPRITVTADSPGSGAFSGTKIELIAPS